MTAFLNHATQPYASAMDFFSFFCSLKGRHNLVEYSKLIPFCAKIQGKILDKDLSFSSILKAHL
jgi:hypothetical protein